jgi:hypothetical protein
MNKGPERQESARVRERRQVDEAQESKERAQARERVRAAQERERQDREQRAATSRHKAEQRALVARTRPAPPTPAEGAGTAPPSASGGERGPARHATPTDQVTTATTGSVMSVHDVIELFNHPLGQSELHQALRALEADPAWSRVPDEDEHEDDDDDRLTCVLVHHPSGTRVPVAQERSMVGIWNSRI